MKFIKWLVKSLFISLVLLFITNLVGRYVNINLPINVYTISIVGLFRIPGIIVLIIFFLL